MHGDSANAVAGPSNLRTSSQPSPPQLFLPPPGLNFLLFIFVLIFTSFIHFVSAPPKTHPALLSSTQDLLARFSLLPAYDKYVRPFAAPGETGLDQNGPVSAFTGANGVPDKGKGKEMVDTPGSSGVADGGDGDDDEATGKGEKKTKNTYKHLIKGVPGMFRCLHSVFSFHSCHICGLRQTFDEERRLFNYHNTGPPEAACYYHTL